MDPNTRDVVTLLDDAVQALADLGYYNEAAAVHAVMVAVQERSRHNCAHLRAV